MGFNLSDLTKPFYSEDTGVNWKNVIPAIAGIASLAGSGATTPGNVSGIGTVGYQGGVPTYNAVRAQVPLNDPARRPGSSGQRYFSDTVYASPANTAAAQVATTSQAAQAADVNLANPNRQLRPQGVTQDQILSAYNQIMTGPAYADWNTDQKYRQIMAMMNAHGVSPLALSQAIGRPVGDIQQVGKELTGLSGAPTRTAVPGSVAGVAALGGISPDQQRVQDAMARLTAYNTRTTAPPVTTDVPIISDYGIADYPGGKGGGTTTGGKTNTYVNGSVPLPGNVTASPATIAAPVATVPRPAYPTLPTDLQTPAQLDAYIQTSKTNAPTDNRMISGTEASTLLSAAQAMNLSPAQMATKLGVTEQEVVNRVKADLGSAGSDYLKKYNYAKGGIAALNTGGMYLGGPTDGMADELPANIDGKQEAALSHGEFVIPADVVGHLGNGNSDAGAQVLYGMMDRIRKARTGTAEQGKKINPGKMLPT